MAFKCVCGSQSQTPPLLVNQPLWILRRSAKLLHSVTLTNADGLGEAAPADLGSNDQHVYRSKTAKDSNISVSSHLIEGSS